MTESPDTVVVDSLRLTDELRELIDGAPGAGKPLVIAYVGSDGKPRVSVRGTIQTFGDSTLALWSRSMGLPDSIAGNPHVSLLYLSLEQRTMLRLSGTAGVVTDEALRDRVFTRSPEREQAQDPERLGAAVVIELDRVEGMTPSGPVGMHAALPTDPRGEPRR